MSLTESVDFEKVLHELFRYSYLSNCELMDEELGTEELETLQDLDTAEVLENFKDLVQDLLSFKRSSLKSEKSELILQNEQFEAMLQKLEGEVRNHIRIEQQLKLHLESSQAKLDEAEKSQALLQEKLDLVEARLAGLGDPLVSPVSQLEGQLKALEERYKHEISRLTLEHTTALKHTRHNRVASDAYVPKEHRSRRTPSPKRPEDPKKPDERGSLRFDVLRQKLEDKSKELEQMHKLLRHKTRDQLSERIKDEVLREELEIVKRLSNKESRPESRQSSKVSSSHKKTRSTTSASYRVPERKTVRSAKGTTLM